MSTERCGCTELVLISKLPSAQERLSLWSQASHWDSKQKAVYICSQHVYYVQLAVNTVQSSGYGEHFRNQDQTTFPRGAKTHGDRKKRNTKTINMWDRQEGKRAEMAWEWWAALTSLEKGIPALLLLGHKYSSLPCSLLLLCHTTEVNFGGLQ